MVECGHLMSADVTHRSKRAIRRISTQGLYPLFGHTVRCSPTGADLCVAADAPLTLLRSHPEGSLVRFRAMVQDTSPSPEMYLARHGTQCGGWGLDPGDQDQINYADLRERAVLWAITVPGESAWCTDLLDGVLPQEPAIHNPSRPHKFPVPHAPHIGVQVKVLSLTRTFDALSRSYRYMTTPRHSNLPIYTTLSGY